MLPSNPRSESTQLVAGPNPKSISVGFNIASATINNNTPNYVFVDPQNRPGTWILPNTQQVVNFSPTVPTLTIQQFTAINGGPGVAGTTTVDIVLSDTPGNPGSVSSVTSVSIVSPLGSRTALSQSIPVNLVGGAAQNQINLATVNGTGINLGRIDQANSLPVTLSSNEIGGAYADKVVSSKSGVNAINTLTLPAAVGAFHFIKYIFISRSCTAAIVGSAILDYTTTNLNGMAWMVGNALAVGATQIDINNNFQSPLVSAIVNTATTIVVPAIGAAGISEISVAYYTGVKF